jgi:Na+/melibiose symporter-like transporter
MNGLTLQEIKDKLDNYLTEGNGNNVENLMVNILGTNIINMDFAFEIKIALNNNDVDAAKEVLSKQAQYLSAIYEQVMSIAFPLFFTNVFGLSFADAAVLMLVARMFDVVTDPLMGTLADRTQSRFGTYRPWLIYGAIPFGLIFALLLYTPDFGPVGKRIYAYALYLLMMAVYTMVNVPYGSLLGVMTEDDDEKNQFSSFRMVGAYAMGFVTLLSFPYLQKMVGGSAAHQYAVIGAALGTSKVAINQSFTVVFSKSVTDEISLSANIENTATTSVYCLLYFKNFRN